MSLTRPQLILQITGCLLGLWLTAIALHISLHPYLLTGPPSNPGDIILLWTIAPAIWWTAFIWLCDTVRSLYQDAIYVFLIGSCVGTAFGILAAVLLVDDEKWGPLVWGLGALWAVTLVVTAIAIYFVCSRRISCPGLGAEHTGECQSQNYEDLRGRSSESTIFSEEDN
ncbi:hypothetical protein ONS96_010130 [Cadophora gregata f. sp. sojae]|nr:hypothetical protein ONS96_010130 [Cadophora gregata f. sp. sojae]